jgi:hypothetical protein
LTRDEPTVGDGHQDRDASDLLRPSAIRNHLLERYVQ